MSWAAILALVAVAGAFAVVAWLLYRSLPAWPALPPWTWTDIKQLIALVGTVAGAAILTDLFWWHSDRRLDQLDRILGLLAAGKGGDPLASIGQTLAEGATWDGKLLAAGVLCVILSLGFVIGRRKYRLKTPGGGEAELSAGDDDQVVEPAPPPAPPPPPDPAPRVDQDRLQL